MMNSARLAMLLVAFLAAAEAPVKAGKPIEPNQDAAPAPGGSSCQALESLRLQETTITFARIIPAGGFAPPRGAGGSPRERRGEGDHPAPGEGAEALPAFCRVAGVVAPAIRFEIWLPPPTGAGAWNGKLNGVGNGGLAGSIGYGAMAEALARGYATASTDTGHTNEPGREAWALGHPDLLVDFASRSIHVTASAAKAVVREYYGRGPDRSYFTGCSCGGGQALSQAQRYPADYDGIVAGAPANYPTHMWPGELYPAWVTHRSPASMLPEEKLTLVHDAVLAFCDAMDGVEDEILDDPRRCRFAPSTLACKDGDATDCLTAEQVDSVQRIYEGLADPSSGRQFWPGFERSSELGWTGHVSKPFGSPLSYFKYMAFQDPSWDWRRFDFSDPGSFAALNEASRRLGPVLDSTNPGLAAFKKRGGKLIAYHGWVDPNIAPRNSISYYEAVQEAMGGAPETSSFYRLFMVPGMGHCGGGPGPSRFDALTALEQWVEHGTPPDRIVASRTSEGRVDRTRPLCPYPLVAQYRGEGSTDDAASFECRVP